MNVIGDVKGKRLHPLRRHGRHGGLALQRGQGHRRHRRRDRGPRLRHARRALRPGHASASRRAAIKELTLLDTMPAIGEGLSATRSSISPSRPMFAEAIERTYQEISISKLFR
jgi:hypothetical protein